MPKDRQGPLPQPRQIPPPDVDAHLLERDLREAVRGEVRFDDASLGLYSTDASNYRQIPIGVVVPRDVDDVLRTLEICRRHRAPITARGAATSLAGQTCNAAVILDFSKYMNRILEVNPEERTAWVEPGVILDSLQLEAGKHDLMFGADPATHNHCTFGGMLGNNSGGVHALLSGKADENTIELDIVTIDGVRLRVGATDDETYERMVQRGGRIGEIYRRLRALRDEHADEIRRRYPDIPRRVSGYGLNHLLPENGFQVAQALVGTEGTCAIILAAKVRLVPNPPCRALVLMGFPDVFIAADHVPQVLEHEPIGLEGMDEELVEYMRLKHLNVSELNLLPRGDAWLLAEFGGDTAEEAERKAQGLMDALKRNENPPTVEYYSKPEDQEQIWKVRESGLAATAHVPSKEDTWPGWEDAAVPAERLGEYLREFRDLQLKYGYEASLYGHFGQGVVHCRMPFDFKTAAGIEKWTNFLEEAAHLAVRYGGSLTGEHGNGNARSALLPIMYGDQIVRAFGEFKSIWDPEGLMNPGNVVNPVRPDQNLRVNEQFAPIQLETNFQFPEDGHSFTGVALRCVGVGKCRREDGGVMCPSFMVTREEMHSTRGRARMLFEMLVGDEVSDGWKSWEVKDALHLCLSCKGCKSDCPVNVDMATYKSEFLSHYYEGRLRPRNGYAFGLIHWWARAASLAPEAVNFLTHAPGFSRIAKLAANMAPQRHAPNFAPRTFRAWFDSRPGEGESNPERKKVILWADTFNNHFHPEVAQAAVEVLEHAGYEVTIPRTVLCCGRPLYEYGMLDQARRQLRGILTNLREEIRAGVPVVGLEPSCVSVFRDELTNLYPDDLAAQRLRDQTFMLSEFLTAEGYEPPKLHRKALVHAHCHHHAVMTMDAELKLLDAMGLDYQKLDSGCCGMAGSFGFEAGDRYEVSVQAGERVLLPAVRDADERTLIITDGFSCMEQIRQGTPRRALHVAQVLQMAIRQGDAPAQPHPEREYVPERPGVTARGAAMVGLGLVCAGVLGARVLAGHARRPAGHR